MNKSNKTILAGMLKNQITEVEATDVIFSHN